MTLMSSPNTWGTISGSTVGGRRRFVAGRAVRTKAQKGCGRSQFFPNHANMTRHFLILQTLTSAASPSW
jgi:hypothetical protein